MCVQNFIPMRTLKKYLKIKLNVVDVMIVVIILQIIKK